MTDILDQLRRLDPAAPNDPAAAVTPQTRTTLLDTITATEAVPLRRSFLRRRVVPALVAASLLGGVALTTVQLSGDNRNEALAFRTEGDKLRIRIVDLYADTERFNKELKKHDLDFRLKLMPVTPSVVGLDVAGGGVGDDGEPSKSKSTDRTLWHGLTPAGCELGGSSPCALEIVVGKGFRGNFELHIGRPARPGEEVAYAGQIDAKGEPLAGVKYQGMRVDAVRKILAERGFKIRDFRVQSVPKASVPGHWIVSDGTTWSSTEVTLWAAPKQR